MPFSLCAAILVLSGLNLLADLSGGSTLVAFACAALSAAVFIFIFGITADPADSAPHRSHLDQLFERRDAVYENLRDLKFEYRAGKFAEPDYEASRLALETEAAMVLAEIEQVTQSPSLAGRRAPTPTEKAAR
jgi:hypothetical protein